MESLKNVGYSTRVERIELAQSFGKINAWSPRFAYQQYISNGAKYSLITQIAMPKEDMTNITGQTYLKITTNL